MSLDELDRLLAVAAKSVDEAAASLVRSSLNDEKARLHGLAVALGKIVDVQLAIYAVRPDLEPAHLREQSPYPPDESRKYGDALIKAMDLAESGDERGATEVWLVFPPW